MVIVVWHVDDIFDSRTICFSSHRKLTAAFDKINIDFYRDKSVIIFIRISVYIIHRVTVINIISVYSV